MDFEKDAFSELKQHSKDLENSVTKLVASAKYIYASSLIEYPHTIIGRFSLHRRQLTQQVMQMMSSQQWFSSTLLSKVCHFLEFQHELALC